MTRLGQHGAYPPLHINGTPYHTCDCCFMQPLNAPPACTCGHKEQAHGYDRKGRPVCRGTSVCACAEYRGAGK